MILIKHSVQHAPILMDNLTGHPPDWEDKVSILPRDGTTIG
jgi:hypothetical protein